MRCRCCRWKTRSATSDVRDFVDQMYRFLGRPKDEPIALTAEPKIDGLSMSLRYEKRQLVLGATRGDGVAGEDVTANVRTIKDIPHALPKGAPDVVEVRGEIYLGKDDFAALNRSQAEARRGALRQSAQHRRRLAPPEEPGGHRVAAAPLLRLCLGRDERAAGRHADGHGRGLRRLGLPGQSADAALRRRRRGARRLSRRSRSSGPGSTTTSTASSTRSTRSPSRRASASARAARAGRSPTSSRPRRRRPCSRPSTSRSAAPAR